MRLTLEGCVFDSDTREVFRSVDVSAAYFASLYGMNDHKIHQGLSFGVSWSCSPVQVYRRLVEKKSND
jgi:hypothetical protein